MTRRSQQERSAETKARLVEATLDAISAHGYQGASLSVILKTAGVSRGAWAHHYDSKGALVADAASDLLLGSVGRARQMLDNLDRDFDRQIGFLWQNFYQGRHRDVLFEMMNACRTDADLNAVLMPVFMEFRSVIEHIWQDLFDRFDDGDEAFRDLAQLTIYVLRGMALDTLLTGDRPDLAVLRRQWGRYLAERSGAPGQTTATAVA